MTDTANAPTGGSDGRDAALLVRAPKILMEELANVENALKHPPKKADWSGMATTLVASALAVGKTLQQFDAKHLYFDVIVIMAATAVAAAAYIRWLDAKKQATPFHDLALRQVQALIKSLPAPPPASTAAIALGPTGGPTGGTTQSSMGGTGSSVSSS